jgi:hypothetical protein
MVRKLVYFVLVLALAGNAFAVNAWTNGTLDGLWQTPGNWSLGVLPNGADGQNMQINPGGGALVGPFVGAGIAASTGQFDSWAPEGGLDLEIQGGSFSGPAFIGLNAYNWLADQVSEINLGRKVDNVTTGGSIDIGEFLFGESWWAHGGGYVAYNQWSGDAVVRGWCWMGGKMNLYGGKTTITGGFNMDPYKNWKGYAQITIYMPDPDPLSGGMLDLPVGLFDSKEIGRWIAEGYLVAGGDAVGRHIVYDTLSEPGRVILTAVPEPATMTLLCLGALALIRRKRS